MRKVKRRSRQTAPKISEVDSSSTNNLNTEYLGETESTDEKNYDFILDEKETKRAELVTNLNEAVARWREEQKLPKQEKKSTISKILKKFDKKDKKRQEAYETAQRFLKKISNFNPTEIEKINLDDKIHKETPEKRHKHQRNIEGEKLEVNLSEKPIEEEKKEEKQETKIKAAIAEREVEEIDLSLHQAEKKESHRKEIEHAIKAHHKTKEVYDNKSLHIEVQEADENDLKQEEKIVDLPLKEQVKQELHKEQEMIEKKKEKIIQKQKEKINRPKKDSKTFETFLRKFNKALKEVQETAVSTGKNLGRTMQQAAISAKTKIQQKTEKKKEFQYPLKKEKETFAELEKSFSKHIDENISRKLSLAEAYKQKRLEELKIKKEKKANATQIKQKEITEVKTKLQTFPKEKRLLNAQKQDKLDKEIANIYKEIQEL